MDELQCKAIEEEQESEGREEKQRLPRASLSKNWYVASVVGYPDNTASIYSTEEEEEEEDELCDYVEDYMEI